MESTEDTGIYKKIQVDLLEGGSGDGEEELKNI